MSKQPKDRRVKKIAHPDELEHAWQAASARQRDAFCFRHKAWFKFGVARESVRRRYPETISVCGNAPSRALIDVTPHDQELNSCWRP